MTTHRPVCKALIFDLDGTLIDSAPDIAASINEYFAEQGWPQLDVAFVERFIGNGPRRLLLDLMQELGLPGDDDSVTRALAGYLAAYRRAPSRHTRFYNAVKEDLQELHAHGFLLGICTNKPQDLTLRILDILGIRHLFSAVAGADDVPACKPNPIHLLTVAQRMGLDDGTWVYVGDTIVDQSTAARAKVPFYAVSWGTGRYLDVAPTQRLNRLSELATLRHPLAQGEIRK